MISIGGLLSSRIFIVRGDSMRPVYAESDVLLVSRRASKAGGPGRGDVVVVRHPRGSGRLDLKRVIGLPKEQVTLREGLLYVNGQQVDEPYLGGFPSSIDLAEMTWSLKNDEYIVLGDRRFRSTDSRKFGPVKACHIFGKVWIRIWPIRRA